MASRKYKPGEYFRCSVLTKSIEQSLEQSEDNGVDILRKDLDGDEPVVEESLRESRSTRKNMEEDLPHEKVATKDTSTRKIEFAAKIFCLSAILSNHDSVRDKTLHVKGGYLLPW